MTCPQGSPRAATTTDTIWFVKGDIPGESPYRAGTYVSTASPYLGLAINLDDGNSYSDLRFDTNIDHLNCDPNQILASRNGYCGVDSPGIRNNEYRSYYATVSGRKNGRWFSRTASISIRALDLHAEVYVDGKRVNDTIVNIPDGKVATIRYDLHNDSNVTLSTVRFHPTSPVKDKCLWNRVAPRWTRTCTFTVSSTDPVITSFPVRGYTLGSIVVEGAPGWRGAMSIPAPWLMFPGPTPTGPTVPAPPTVPTVTAPPTVPAPPTVTAPPAPPVATSR